MCLHFRTTSAVVSRWYNRVLRAKDFNMTRMLPVHLLSQGRTFKLLQTFPGERCRGWVHSAWAGWSSLKWADILWGFGSTCCPLVNSATTNKKKKPNYCTIDPEFMKHKQIERDSIMEIEFKRVVPGLSRVEQHVCLHNEDRFPYLLLSRHSLIGCVDCGACSRDIIPCEGA